jgi:hypothetical protein
MDSAMPIVAPDLTVADLTLLLLAIVALLVPLLIWLFHDLDRRWQRAGARVRPRLARSKP